MTPCAHAMKSWKAEVFVSVSTLTIFSIISVALSYSLFLVTRDMEFATQLIEPSGHYTYEAFDHPAVLPIDLGRPVQTVREESVHFGVDDAESAIEWQYNTSPYGAGLTRLGPELRTFIVDMVHPMHCLRYIRGLIVKEQTQGVDHPISHCFDALRRMSLCQADLTLEPGDFVTCNFTASTVGQTHICRDWEVVYKTLQAGWVSWFQYRIEHDISAT
ncbi:hypothetical protein DENSPDRAFT_661611 [Dentipellis sp. KUC8613]|nr:hypothetical protein DENSPDRAFT_661611 [Dentipellis sp. KUC8613]